MSVNKEYEKNNIIVFTYYNINGALIDAIEYYLCAKKYNDSVKLFILVSNSYSVSTAKQNIENIIYDRYNIESIYVDDIIYKKRDTIGVYKINTLLILDVGTFNDILHFFFKSLILLFDAYEMSKYRYRYNKYYKLSKDNNIYIYNEMPFVDNIPVNYKFKFYFDIYKRYDNFDNNVFYSSNSKKLPDKDRVFKLLDKIDSNQKLIIGCNPNIAPLYKDTRIIYSNKHPKDYFQTFNTYLYYHFGEYFDPRPRLFHESVFYNKKIIYVNENNIKDGSWYRYNDSVVNKDIKERYMNNNDEAVKELIHINGTIQL